MRQIEKNKRKNFITIWNVKKKKIHRKYLQRYSKKNVKIEILILKKKKLFINIKQIEKRLKLLITQIKLYLFEIELHDRIFRKKLYIRSTGKFCPNL